MTYCSFTTIFQDVMDSWLRGKPALFEALEFVCKQIENDLWSERNGHEKKTSDLMERIEELEQHNKQLQGELETLRNLSTKKPEVDREFSKLYHRFQKLDRNYKTVKQSRAKWKVMSSKQEDKIKILEQQAEILRGLPGNPPDLPPDSGPVCNSSTDPSTKQSCSDLGPPRPQTGRIHHIPDLLPLPLSMDEPRAIIKQEHSSDGPLFMSVGKRKRRTLGVKSECGSDSVATGLNAGSLVQESLDLDDSGIAFPTPKKRRSLATDLTSEDKRATGCCSSGIRAHVDEHRVESQDEDENLVFTSQKSRSTTLLPISGSKILDKSRNLTPCKARSDHAH